ncbi:MAG TPA: glycosyltransferase family 39 protein [Chloroflexota bacterium]
MFAWKRWGAVSDGLLLLGVLVVAAFLRLSRLDEVPPGLHFDEAAYGVLALDVLRGDRPIFFSAYASREPLFVYLVALSISLVGQTPLAIRLVAALAGVLAVATTYWAGRLLLGRAVGLLGAGAMAVSFWPVLTTRLGYRANLVPLFVALVVALLWRAGQRNRFLDWAVAGGVLGLSLYTYLSARAIPILVAVFLLGQLLFDRDWVRRRWRGIGLYGLVAVLVATPLALHFAYHPDDFVERMRQAAVVSVGSNGADGRGTVLDHTLRTLGMFAIRGDEDPKYNLPGQPVFDPLPAALFVLGLAVAVRRGRSSAERLVLLWLLVMLLPGALSVDSPHFLRTLGAAPAAHLLLALGLATVLRWVSRGAPPALARRAGWLGGAAAVVVLTALGLQTADRYFRVWGASVDTFVVQMGDVAAAARVLDELPGDGAIYVATTYAPHPTVAYVGSRRYGAVRWFDPTKTFVLPPPGTPAYYVVPSTPAPVAAEPYLASLPVVREGRRPDGSASYRVYALPADARPRLLSTDRWARVAGVLQLRGGDIPTRVTAGQDLVVRTAWQVLERSVGEVRLSMRLVDEQGEVWAQVDEGGLGTEAWEAGTVLAVEHRLRVPATAPPLVGRVVLVAYDGASLEPLSMQHAEGVSADLQLGSVRVERPRRPPVEAPRGDAVAPGLFLRRAALDAAEVVSGAPLKLRFLWQAGEGERPSEVSLQLWEAGRAVGSKLSLPVVPDYPPSRWQPGEVVEQRVVWLLPPTLASGRYNVVVAGPTGGVVPVGEVQVRAPERRFEPPPIDVSDGRTFVGRLRLVGYSLTRRAARPGDVVEVEIAWQALEQVDRSLKVFVHLLDAEGRLRAQHDKYPLDGARPTTGWLSGEVVVDRYRLAIPAQAPIGTYRIAVGWYDERTGRRLMAEDGRDHLVLATPIVVQP